MQQMLNLTLHIDENGGFKAISWNQREYQSPEITDKAWTKFMEMKDRLVPCMDDF